MPSMKCAHCIKIKQCRMVKGLVSYEYLCAPCRRELGYDGARELGYDGARDEGGES